MSDKISSIDEETESKKDRSSLNVGGRTKNNKGIIIVLFLFAALAVLMTGLNFAFSGVDTIEELAPTDNNFIAGADKSRLDDSNDYFDSLRKEKQRKKDAELAKQKKLEAELAEQEAAKAVKKAKPIQVTRTSQTPSRRQPKPTVARSSGGSKKKELTPEQRKMQGSVLVMGGGNKATSSRPPPFSKSFNASVFENGQASLRDKGSLDFMLIHGTSLPCALYTQIISDYEGFVTCRITQDVYSANGAALLVEKGSMVSGTQSVAIEQGKARIFTSWADIETPLGVSIRIDSLGTGQLGAAGIEAWVDNHFKQRFGGAILLSFIDDALGALSDNFSGSGIGVDNSTKNGSDMASKALESSIDIKPTGYAFIGQRINILVARDIDMSEIYRFEEE